MSGERGGGTGAAEAAEGGGGAATQAHAAQPVRDEHLRYWFESLEGQTHAARLGMWVFIASEGLLFSALFALYAGYRARWGHVFGEAAGHTDLWIGSGGTVVLLAASLVVALGVHAVRKNRRSATGFLLWGAALMGAGFLALKGWEYVRHYREGILPGPWYHYPHLTGEGAIAFFNLYYVMTGLHALHVVVGVALLVWLGKKARGGAYDPEWHTPVELGGMYWHFVDVVWLFLWPAFYLMR